MRCPRETGEILNGDEAKQGAESALVASAGPPPAPSGHGGERAGSGQPLLTRTQRQARIRDRAAIERGRRPSVLQLIRRARLFPEAHRELVGIARKTEDEQLRVRIWTVLFESSTDAAMELLDRSGLPKIKTLELHAFDDLAREIERDEQPAHRDVTPEMIEEATTAVLLAGAGRVQAIDIPYEELRNAEGMSGPH